jgi:hypothetical protein
MKSTRFLFVVISATLLNACFSNQEPQQLDNIKTFANAYGFVKYFHPSDEAYAIDWNKFAIYGAEKVLECEDEDELRNTLHQLFKPIAPSIVFQNSSSLGPYDITSIIPAETNEYESTYWQHRGVSYWMNSGYRDPYSSVRVNSRNEIEVTKRFGMITMPIEASNYLGKTIKFRALAKSKETSGEDAYLRIAIYREDGTADLERTFIDGKDWNEYEVEKVIDSSAYSIVVGAGLKNKGALLFDDTKLYYKEGEDWIEIPLANNGFESGVIAGQMDWNKWVGEGQGYDFGVTGAEYYAGSKSAKIEFAGTTTRGKPIFETQPEFGALIKQSIGSNTACQIPLVLKINEKGTYPPADQDALNFLKESLTTISTEPDSLYVRLGNIINTYNVFKHFFPYMDILEMDWDREFEKAVSRSFTDKNGHDHQLTLETFTAPLKDGHINISFDKFTDRFTPRITWEWVEGKLIVTNVLDESLPLHVGDEVTLIEGIDPKEFFVPVYRSISAGTQGWLDFRAHAKSLMGKRGSEMTIEVNGTEVKMERSAHQYNYGDTKQLDYEKISDSVYYLNITQIEMDKIIALLPELDKCKSIICDLRGYPNNNHGLINYLLKENDTTEAWMQIAEKTTPGAMEPGSFKNYNWMLTKKSPYLGDKQIIFLTNRRAISYGESYMGFIDGYDLATIVGEPTAGTNGNINKFDLPGGYTITWTGMKVVKHNGTQLHGIGILPDIYVAKTIEGVKSGRDEVLERAIQMTED